MKKEYEEYLCDFINLLSSQTGKLCDATIMPAPHFSMGGLRGFTVKAVPTVKQVNELIDGFGCLIKKSGRYAARLYEHNLWARTSYEEHNCWFYIALSKLPEAFWTRNGIAICYNVKTEKLMLGRVPLHIESNQRQSEFNWSFFVRGYLGDVLNKEIMEGEQGFHFTSCKVSLQDAVVDFNDHEGEWKILYVVGK